MADGGWLSRLHELTTTAPTMITTAAARSAGRVRDTRGGYVASAGSCPAAYRRPVGKRRKGEDSEAFVRAVQVGIEKGLDVVEAWRQARASRPSPEVRALQQQHAAAVAAHQREVARYQRGVSRLQTQQTAGTVVAGLAGTVGVIDVVAEVVTAQAGVYGPSWIWLGGAVLGAVAAISARRQRRRLPPPPTPVALPPPPVMLPAEAIGAVEASRLTSLRVQLSQVVPALDHLHPGAAQELRRADLEAAPPLHALTERLAVLHRMRQDMPGTAAADAATAAAIDVRERLAQGCGTYERLLAASATLLAAPDMSRSTEDVLGPALQAMSAYAHGLKRAAESG